ncbi:aromatic ring-hydroxylating oxygenase subunit alpha [Mangrovicoccus ximenensis]|uniref:aromatic ring-hydroxylating oxygenase subunit alpha n=1 Tax=Mangrovicoccus ximenensis TaxID=1911570 RepID=UPI001374E0AC|nr:aromatic ring-hydroxylating dioxygenase subunit alpha [Mangrovicoccus ximenensis]
MTQHAQIGSMAAPALPEILRAVHAGRGQTLEDSETLPPAAYASPEFYELECERIFRPGWLAVGHVAQVPEVGDYVSIEVLGEPLVVVRGKDRIRVLSRVCLHRWAPVVEGAGNAKLFSCPFHRWGYDLEGNLRTAPFMEQARNFDKKGMKLPEIRSEIVLGTIYVNFSGDAEPLAPRMAGMIGDWANIPHDELIVGYETQFHCPFNWKIAVETFMECYHHIGAHSRTLEPHNPARLSWGEDMADPDQAFVTLRHPLREDLPTETNLQSGLPVFDGWTEDQIRTGSLYHVFPMNLIGTSVDAVRWTSILPRGANDTWWVRLHLVRREAAELPEFQDMMAKAKENGAVIAGEDVEVNTLQQIGAASRLAQPGRLSHLEKPVWQLADYIRDHIGETV